MDTSKFMTPYLAHSQKMLEQFSHVSNKFGFEVENQYLASVYMLFGLAVFGCGNDVFKSIPFHLNICSSALLLLQDIFSGHSVYRDYCTQLSDRSS